MTTICLNTLRGAVTEYSGFDFQSITPTHAGDAAGLYLLGGNLDGTAAIAASITTAKALIAENRRTHIECIFVSMKGAGTATVTVIGEGVSYAYPMTVMSDGVSRLRPGRGFRENYVGFGFANTLGADFQLDQLEILTAPSTNRRTH
ncbi:MAG: hypothetical protein RLZZ524_1158 [Pseudomonadota bacterium]